MIQSFKVKQNIAGYGVYAEVELDAEIQFGTKQTVEFDQWVDEEWHTSVKFAINLFCDYYKKTLKINVLKLNTMIIDTTNIVVVYAVVKCLCKIFNYSDDIITLEENAPQFIITKR